MIVREWSSFVPVTKTLLISVAQYSYHAYPNEFCGILSSSPGGIVSNVYPVQNVATHPPTGFKMKPEDMLNQFTLIVERHETFVGVIHSHPLTPPIASNEDILGLQGIKSGSLYVIYSVLHNEFGFYQLIGTSLISKQFEIIDI